MEGREAGTRANALSTTPTIPMQIGVANHSPLALTAFRLDRTIQSGIGKLLETIS